MTVKRISTRTEVAGRIPFRRQRREVPDVRVLEPGYVENILVNYYPLSQGSGRTEYQPHRLVVETDNSIRLEPRDLHRWEGKMRSLPPTDVLEREEIDVILGDRDLIYHEYSAPRTDPEKGDRRDVKFIWEPTLPASAKK